MNKRRGRKINFEARVPRVYAKLKPFWERFGIETAGHDEIEASRLALRNSALHYAKVAQDTGLATVSGKHLTTFAAACDLALATLDAAAMKLAAVCELNLARVETQAALDAEERSRKPRRGRKPGRKPKAAQKTRKQRAKKPRAGWKRVLEPTPLPVEKPAKKSAKKKKARASKKP